MRQRDRQRHQFLGLVAGKAEHHALVAGADSFDLGLAHLALFGLQRAVDAQRDIGRLRVQRHNDAAGICVEAGIAVGVADLGHHFANQVLHVNRAFGGDFAHHHHQPGGGRGLACNARARVLRQQRVEHGIADLVADLVRMPLGHRLGS